MRIYERLLKRHTLLGDTFQGAQLYTLFDSWSSADEKLPNDFADYVRGAYTDNGVVFACSLARMLLLSEVEFKYQRLSDRVLFGDRSLRPLEEPWVNGDTGELVARAEQDVTTCGNLYLRKLNDGHVERLRPDWATIITGRSERTGAREVIGYGYLPDGPNDKAKPQTYLPDEIVHWSPIPDPLANFRGMSWITPVVREVIGDKAMSQHKNRFFDNAATVPIVISMKDRMDKEAFKEFAEKVRASHAGEENAYKAMLLNGAADVTLAGTNMEQLAFSVTQAAGENRICVASGVPSIVVGLKEGLSAATYSNYSQAMRRFGDLWGRPTWRSMCAAFRPLVSTPAGARLWYDDRYIAALRQDAKDDAEVRSKQASTIKTLIDAGYEADSVIAAVNAGDWSLLKHTGYVSVQLQKLGDAAPSDSDDDSDDDTGDDE